MIESIEEFAKQHGFIHDNMSTGEKNDALKRFKRISEVIIKECTEQLDDGSEEGMRVRNVLSKHFGIENES